MRRLPHLFSLTVLTLLTSCALAIAADPAPASATVPAANASIASVNNTPAPAATTTPPPLSDKQLKKINDFLAANKQDYEISGIIVDRLKLHPNPYKFKHLPLKDNKTGNMYVYANLSDGGMLFSYIDTTAAYSYHLDSKFNIIASVAMTNYVPSDVKNPEESLKTVLAYWAGVADQLP